MTNNLQGGGHAHQNGGPATARDMWGNLKMGYPLFNRLKYLGTCLNKIIWDLSAKSGILGNDSGSKVNRIKWVLRNHGNGFPGPEMMSDILKARQTLAFFNALTYDNDVKEHPLSPQELNERGFNETTFLITLRQVSVFAAWAYNLEIPEHIQDLLRSLSKRQMTHQTEDLRIDEEDLTYNKSHRFLFVIIIDNSLSMGEDNTLTKMEQCLTRLFHEIDDNAELCKSVELYVATCGGKPQEVADFAMIDRQTLKLDGMMLRPYGSCRMAETIQMALGKLGNRLSLLRKPDYDINYYRPWLLILSDGNFKGDMTPAVESIKSIPRLQVYARGVSHNAKLSTLRTIDNNATILDNLTGFFTDVFNSIERSQSSIPGGEDIELVNRLGFKEKQ